MLLTHAVFVGVCCFECVGRRQLFVFLVWKCLGRLLVFPVVLFLVLGLSFGSLLNMRFGSVLGLFFRRHRADSARGMGLTFCEVLSSNFSRFWAQKCESFWLRFWLLFGRQAFFLLHLGILWKGPVTGVHFRVFIDPLFCFFRQILGSFVRFFLNQHAVKVPFSEWILVCQGDKIKCPMRPNSGCPSSKI